MGSGAKEQSKIYCKCLKKWESSSFVGGGPPTGDPCPSKKGGGEGAELGPQPCHLRYSRDVCSGSNQTAQVSSFEPSSRPKTAKGALPSFWESLVAQHRQ